MQSTVYSQEIHKALPIHKIIKILQFLKKKKIKFYIVSHKTKYPYYGEKVDLHKISRSWLNKNIFNKKNKLNKCKFYFETSIKKKIERIKKLKITHFIDDLKEIIDLLPSNTIGILFKNKKFKEYKIKNLIEKELKVLVI